jgi:MarR family 2-MHQ and catechol resistance regulon transcriptional repressor
MTIASEEIAMPRHSEAAGRQSLAVLLARMDKLPSVIATRALIRAAFLFINSPNRPFNARGLNVSQVDVLGAIARSEGMALTCSEIAEATLITKGGITGILDRLEARGFVQRVASRDDRRSIRIELTEKGVDFCNGLFSELAVDDEAAFAEAFKPEQVKQLSKLLALLVSSLEADSSTARTDAPEPTHGHQRI